MWLQYRRALADKAQDAFYKLSNTRAQIKSYVFDMYVLTLERLNRSLPHNLTAIVDVISERSHIDQRFII